MDDEREIVAYKSYFWDFMDTLTENESKKIYYILDMLKSEIVYPKICKVRQGWLV